MASDLNFDTTNGAGLPIPSYSVLQGNVPLTPPLIARSLYLVKFHIVLNAFQKLIDIFRSGKKSSGKTLKPDPTPISGLGKLRCPWDNPVERQCNGLTLEVASSLSCLPKAVGGNDACLRLSMINLIYYNQL
ncbi:hypothetical protein TNCV_4348641 [Trichonephila clavipes]|nr:hypothetical protein TNCV_4348641 [Trichonephila clavipes]